MGRPGWAVMRTLPLSLPAIAVMLSVSAATAEGQSGARRTEASHIEQLERTLAMGPPGDPVAAADAAAAQGDYRLYWGQAMGGASPLGVTCHAPTYYVTSGPTAEGLVKGVVTFSDVVDANETRFEEAATEYGKAYNHRIVVAAGYPYRDVCRLARDEDRTTGGGPYPARWTVPAGAAGPVRTLADAARVGSRADVTRFLNTPGTKIDEADAFGMTPLAWAVVRGHDAIARQLLAAGASAVGGGRHGSQAPLLYAVAFKRQGLFRTLYGSLSDEAREDLRAEIYATAATNAGDVQALKLFLPEERLDKQAAALRLRSALYRQNYAAADLLVARAGSVLDADDLLGVAVAAGDVRFLDRALKAGADPNGGSDMIETPPLYEIAGSASFVTAPEITRRLIRAGADPDRPSRGGETALQVFVRRGTYPPVYPTWAEPRLAAITARGRTEVLQALVAAGADVNRASHGVPMVMQVLHIGPGVSRPQSYDPAWLRLLARAGMDLNAPLEGRTALAYARAAGDTGLVALLRELGAR